MSIGLGDQSLKQGAAKRIDNEMMATLEPDHMVRGELDQSPSKQGASLEIKRGAQSGVHPGLRRRLRIVLIRQVDLFDPPALKISNYKLRRLRNQTNPLTQRARGARDELRSTRQGFEIEIALDLRILRDVVGGLRAIQQMTKPDTTLRRGQRQERLRSFHAIWKKAVHYFL